jgi:hypothetical protein
MAGERDRVSMLARGALGRLALAAGLIALIWAGVLWALG